MSIGDMGGGFSGIYSLLSKVKMPKKEDPLALPSRDDVVMNTLNDQLAMMRKKKRGGLLGGLGLGGEGGGGDGQSIEALLFGT